MVVTYYIKLFRGEVGRHNGIFMSLLLLVAETIRSCRNESEVLFLVHFSQFINGVNIGFNQMKNSSFSLFIMIKVSVVLFPAKIYLFKIVNRNTRKGCEICSKLTMKILEGPQWFCLGVFIVNFGHISWPFIVFLWLTLNR